MKIIASFDGGGVRGALTTCFLVALEAQLKKPCREIFSMVAGTSTGALIASAIAAGIPAVEILQIYQEDAPKIFNLPSLISWEERLRCGWAFSSDKIAAVLSKRFGPASTWTLNDCPLRILLCAASVNQKPWYFVQDNPQNSNVTGKLSLIECATASAAAPTYLSPVYVSPLTGKLVGWCMDGGIAGSANPTYDACVEAFFYDSFLPSDTQVLSFGTGFIHDATVNPPSGFLATLTYVLDSLLFNAGIKSRQAVERHWPGLQTRLNWQLPKPIDLADASAIPSLIELGTALASKLIWSYDSSGKLMKVEIP